MQKIITLLLLVIVFACSEKRANQVTVEVNREVNHTMDPLLSARFPYLLDYAIDSTQFPRSMNKDSSVHGVPSRDWTSGFFPGSLLQLYLITGDERFLSRGKKWTSFMEKEQYNGITHDMGFKVYCSVGQLYKINPNPHEKEVIIRSATTLSTRYDSIVGSIRSWDFGKDRWQFPVIIDNMMNLELLFVATRLTKDSSYHKIAVAHAQKTLENHFRPDYSSYHVIDYNVLTGVVEQRLTHQGINDSSVWSRGQAWGLYGFVTCYRYTKNQDFLNQAVRIVDFIRNQPLWPEDNIPYWDMKDSRIPNAPRDASAAAVTASACFELYEYTKNEAYLSFANSIVKSLSTSDYILDTNVDAPFILAHSTGDWSKQMELDAPIGYADYYFLEALIRSNRARLVSSKK